MAGAGDGMSKAGGRSKPGDGFLEVNTNTCGYYCRGGPSALLPSPAIVMGNASGEVLSATRNYNRGGLGTLTPSTTGFNSRFSCICLVWRH